MFQVSYGTLKTVGVTNPPKTELEPKKKLIDE